MSFGRSGLSQVVGETLSDARAASEGLFVQTTKHEERLSSDSLSDQLLHDEIRRERKRAQNRASALRVKLRREAEMKGAAVEIDPTFYARRKRGRKIEYIDRVGA